MYNERFNKSLSYINKEPLLQNIIKTPGFFTDNFRFVVLTIDALFIFENEHLFLIKKEAKRVFDLHDFTFELKNCKIKVYSNKDDFKKSNTNIKNETKQIEDTKQENNTENYIVSKKNHTDQKLKRTDKTLIKKLIFNNDSVARVWINSIFELQGERPVLKREKENDLNSISDRLILETENNGDIKKKIAFCISKNTELTLPSTKFASSSSFNQINKRKSRINERVRFSSKFDDLSIIYSNKDLKVENTLELEHNASKFLSSNVIKERFEPTSTEKQTSQYAFSEFSSKDVRNKNHISTLTFPQSIANEPTSELAKNKKYNFKVNPSITPMNKIIDDKTKSHESKKSVESELHIKIKTNLFLKSNENDSKLIKTLKNEDEDLILSGINDEFTNNSKTKQYLKGIREKNISKIHIKQDLENPEKMIITEKSVTNMNYNFFDNHPFEMSMKNSTFMEKIEENDCLNYKPKITSSIYSNIIRQKINSNDVSIGNISVYVKKDHEFKHKIETLINPKESLIQIKNLIDNKNTDFLNKIERTNSSVKVYNFLHALTNGFTLSARQDNSKGKIKDEDLQIDLSFYIKTCHLLINYFPLDQYDKFIISIQNSCYKNKVAEIMIEDAILYLNIITVWMKNLVNQMVNLSFARQDYTNMYVSEINDEYNKTSKFFNFIAVHYKKSIS